MAEKSMALRNPLLIWGALLFGAVPLAAGSVSLGASGYGFVAMGLLVGAVAARVAERRVGDWVLMPWRPRFRWAAVTLAAATMAARVALVALPQETAANPLAVNPLQLALPPLLIGATAFGALALVGERPQKAGAAPFSPWMRAVALVAGSLMAVACPLSAGFPVLPAIGGIACVLAVQRLLQPAAAQAVTIFSLGFVVATSLGRVAFFSELAALSLVVLAVLLGAPLCVRLARRQRERRISAHEASTPQPALAMAVTSFGLSYREVEAVSCLLQGMTSERAAEAMGVKAPTVRTYLRRACQKVGVPNGEALRALLGGASSVEKPAEAEKAGAETVPTPDLASSPTVARAIVALLVLLGLLLVAPLGRPTAWGAGMPQAIGCAWGFGLFALLERRPSNPSRSAMEKALVGGVFSLSLTIAVAVCAGTLNVAMPAAAPIALAACLSRIAAVALSLWALQHLLRIQGVPLGLSSIVVVCATAALCMVSQAAWTCAVGVSLLSAVGCGLTVYLEERTSTPAPQSESARVRPMTALGWTAGGIGAGVLLEEGWRLLNHVSYASLTIPLALGLVGCVAWFAPVALSKMRRGVMAAIALLVALLLLAARPQLFLFLAALVVLGAAAVTAKASYPAIIAGTLERCLAAGIALGLLATLYGASIYGDVAGYNETALEAVGGIAMVHSLAAYLVGTASLVVVVAWGMILRSAQADREALRDCKAVGGAEESVEAWLASCGLNGLQREVALGIYRNESGPQMSERLNYSRSYINNTCNAVYRKLNVHGRSELIDAISQATGL